MSEDVVLTEQRGRVLVITLNRPEAMNAINGALAAGLWAAVQRLNGDDGQIRRGRPRCQCFHPA